MKSSEKTEKLSWLRSCGKEQTDNQGKAISVHLLFYNCVPISKFRQCRVSLTDLELKTELGGKCSKLEPKGMDGSVWWHNPLGKMARTV